LSDAVPSFSLEVRPDRDRILLDLVDVRFIDSQGLRLLLDVDRRAGADVRSSGSSTAPLR
jgi:anti-anti-sigma regulatory factor